jgi:hypothetical protein
MEEGFLLFLFLLPAFPSFLYHYSLSHKRSNNITSLGNVREVSSLYSNLTNFTRESLAANLYVKVLESCEILDE